MRLTRRSLLAGAAALASPLAAPSLAAAEAARVLKFIPQADLAIVDPSWTTAYITRNHAMLVYDTLYGTDAANAVSPQMLDGHRIEEDGKTWLMTLRDGLQFHDGTPVRARDCVASIRRWTNRDNYGQTVAAVTDELTAVDDKTIRFRLKRPFPLLPAALGKPGSAVCAIMPERLAAGDPAKPITEVVGSGPYRFKADERIAGARVVYERNAGYRPRESGESSFTAGPKRVNFDRVEWNIIPDAATAGAALQAGEVDWWEVPAPDLLPVLRANKSITISVQDKTGFLGFMRVNHLTPPFNNPAIRRLLFAAVDQQDFVTAAVGTDPSLSHTPIGFFSPGSPMASDAGLEALTSRRDPERVKRELKAAGYAGEQVVVLVPTDFPGLKALADVGADVLARNGFNTVPVYLDWGSMVQRLSRVEAPEQGGWNVYHSYWSGLDQWDPAVNSSLRATGRTAGRPGWPDSPRLEALREQWLQAPDLAAQQRLARDIQLQAFEDVPYVPLGQTFAPTAYRSDISGLPTGYALFWNVKRG
jgi:peptide/nickel transport system substrate-binding protein